jgi:hypothetical protein
LAFPVWAFCVPCVGCFADIVGAHGGSHGACHWSSLRLYRCCHWGWNDG